MPAFDYTAAYSAMHKKNGKVFSGRSALPHAAAIAELVRVIKPERILDYGCGKGIQYSHDKIHETWGGLKPHLFDVGVPKYAAKPEGKFNGIICTDVMEHIHPDDVKEVLDDIFSYVGDGPAFVFFAISTRPAKKTFPSGKNVHLTVRGPTWWQEAITGRTTENLRVTMRFT